MNDKKIRILIVDDHAVVRKGIRALLATETDLEVIGEGKDGTLAVELYDQLDPDLLLLDRREEIGAVVESGRAVVLRTDRPDEVSPSSGQEPHGLYFAFPGGSGVDWSRADRSLHNSGAIPVVELQAKRTEEIASLLDHQEEWPALSQQAQAKAQKYSWESINKGLLQSYRSLIDSFHRQ